MSLKPIIKSAREALDRKDYPYALQLCTDALAFEPENYWLLVFKAVALGAQEQTEAALLEYTKAAKAQADNPTAFQGIVNLYETRNLDFDERYHSALESMNLILFNQYKTKFLLTSILTSYRKECEKHLALVRKRLNLYKEAKNISESLKLLNWLAGPEAESFYPPQLLPSKVSLWQEQFDLLAPLEAAQISKDIETGRMRLNSATDSLDRLIDRCHIQNYSRQLTDIIRNLSTVKPEKFIEILSNRLFKIVLSDFCPSDQVRQEYSNELLKLCLRFSNPVLQSIKYNLNQEGETCESFVGPRSVLESLKSEKDQERVLKLINELEIVTKKWSRAFNTQILDTYDPIALKLKLKALISLNYFEDALQLIPQFSPEDLLDDLLFDPVLTVLESSRELSRVISLIESKLMQIDPEHPHLILRLVDNLIEAQRYNEASEYLQAIPEAYPDLDHDTEARLSFATGLCAWHTGDRSKTTLAHFLNSAKLNPQESKHFEWIGKFYWRIEKEAERALKCFTKALNLDPLNLQAAILFSEVTSETETDNGLDVITKLLQPFTKTSSQARNRRLFYYYGVALFKSKNYLDASVSFQSALKGSLALYHEDTTDPLISDENCLQWLGEAYLRSNRLGSAAKTFTRLAAISAGDGFVTAQVGLASVHLKSNNPIEAVDCLSEVDSSDPKVKLEKTKSFLALARFYLRQGRFISATRALVNSLKTAPLTTAEGLRLAADALCLAFKYGDIVNFPREDLASIEFGDLHVNAGLQEISTKLPCSLAGKSAQLALAGISEAFKDPKAHSLSSFWLQLAICLSACDSSGDLDEFIISAAANAVNEMDSNDSMKSQGHHIQALVYARIPKTHQLAQHHFISALKHCESSPLWTDLGRFYLKAGDWQLASDAFKRALAVDQEDLVAAFELARCSGTVEGNEAAVQVAQRAFTQQPVHFTEEFALVLAQNDCGTVSSYAQVYLKRLHPYESSSFDIPSFPSKLELLNHLNASDSPEIWLSPAASEFDCEFLLKRPQNEVTQSGWRAVVEGLLPTAKERTKRELEELNQQQQ